MKARNRRSERKGGRGGNGSDGGWCWGAGAGAGAGGGWGGWVDGWMGGSLQSGPFITEHRDKLVPPRSSGMIITIAIIVAVTSTAITQTR
uniref:Uncharacterized protein n=1 Tax=Vespula pensylvanica TaxID=30213 RepID=A0A834JS65_VESPE|nr:hypothetical protein H0235_017748 [Vespula pensylvanica]